MEFNFGASAGSSTAMLWPEESETTTTGLMLGAPSEDLPPPVVLVNPAVPTVLVKVIFSLAVVGKSK